MQIKFASEDTELTRCFSIMVQLRPYLTISEFNNRIKYQQQAGYFLIYLEEEDAIKAVAGFRILEKLSDGRQLYVDDLITDASKRSRGYGSTLLDWLVDYAKSLKCSSLQLDSGVQRAEAHRFYFRKGMKISSFHFNLSLNS
jgi:GNAT superfamily N-acetyltransferase